MKWTFHFETREHFDLRIINQYGEYRFDEAECIEKADGSIYYRIELEKGDVDKVVNIGENGTVLS